MHIGKSGRLFSMHIVATQGRICSATDLRHAYCALVIYKRCARVRHALAALDYMEKAAMVHASQPPAMGMLCLFDCQARNKEFIG